MHIVKDTDFFSQDVRWPDLAARVTAALHAWRARETERRLLLGLSDRLREDCGAGHATRCGGER